MNKIKTIKYFIDGQPITKDAINDIGFKMDPAQKKIWIDALRSGQYNQISKLLGDENGNCCLGVGLRCLFDINQEILISSKITSIWHFSETTRNESYEFIPVKIGGILMAANDSGEFTFLDIADWIEENL